MEKLLVTFSLVLVIAAKNSSPAPREQPSRSEMRKKRTAATSGRLSCMSRVRCDVSDPTFQVEHLSLAYPGRREESRGADPEEQSRQGERLQAWLPALAKHYGYPAGSPATEFFTEHAEADVEHSRRQAELCIKYCDTNAQKARALEVAEQACMLRWASVTDLYRRDYLGEKDILPPGVNG